MNPPQASVLVPCYNGASTVARLLEALAAQDTARPFEVIVVDDGSTDRTPSVLAEWAEAHPDFPLQVLRQDNAGPAAARNRAAREARGRWLLFTDADCAPRPDWIETTVSCLEANPDAGAVGGSYDIANAHSPLARLIHAEILWRHSRMGPRIRFAGSYNLGIDRELFLSLGGFSTRYRTASGEDNDLSYRILKAGRAIAFCPASRVAHHHTERLGQYLKEQYRHGKWRALLYRRHPDMMRGDDYTGLKDVAEVPLALAAAASGLAAPGAPALLPVFLLTAATLGALELLGALEVARRRPGVAPLPLAGMTFLRAFARGGGLLAGLVAARGRAR
ncbi:MAG: hypothetical protein Kow0092_03700 [Deferrisomatales bacterium]